MSATQLGALAIFTRKYNSVANSNKIQIIFKVSVEYSVAMAWAQWIKSISWGWIYSSKVGHRLQAQLLWLLRQEEVETRGSAWTHEFKTGRLKLCTFQKGKQLLQEKKSLFIRSAISKLNQNSEFQLSKTDTMSTWTWEKTSHSISKNLPFCTFLLQIWNSDSHTITGLFFCLIQ